MNLYFTENMKLRKILYTIDIALAAIYTGIAFSTRSPLQASTAVAIIAVFLVVLSNTILNRRDDSKVGRLLNVLYRECNPALFIEDVNREIDLTAVNNEVRTLVLLHKANALCYEGLFSDAHKIIDELNASLKKESDRYLILSNSINYRLIEENYEGLDEDIEDLQNHIKQSGKKAKKKTFLTNMGVMQKKLQLKISRGEKLNSSEVNTLWEITKLGGNNLNLETLRYYSSLFLLQEKDIKGAIEQLKKIAFNEENTVIEKRAKKLFTSLTIAKETE